MKYFINGFKSTLKGSIAIPSSKSHSLRAILFASFGIGDSIIYNVLTSPDASAMISACKMFGAKIDIKNTTVKIHGVSGKITTPEDVINVGNSGQVLRFMTAIAAMQDNHVVFTGDYSIRHNRPMQPLIDGLNGLGAACISTKNDGYAPIIVKGPIRPGTTFLDGEDSQPVSSLLIASSFLNGKTEIFVKNPGEKPWIDLTLSWLDRINVKYSNNNYKHYVVNGNGNYSGFEYTVPGDFSSLLFPIAAALITQSEITLKNVDMDDIQGDKKALSVLESMGAKFNYNKLNKELTILKTDLLNGIEIDVNDFIDSVPVLAVVGIFARGKTIIKNAAIARKKECDRISAIAIELKKMGANIQELHDGLIIQQSDLTGAIVESHNDHRIAMALTVAGLIATGITHVNDVDCVAKSYYSFYDDIKYLGADICCD